jgi:hypothetical protein
MDLYHQVSNTVYFLFLFCDRASCFCTSVKHSLFFFFVLFFLWERGGRGSENNLLDSLAYTNFYVKF